MEGRPAAKRRRVEEEGEGEGGGKGEVLVASLRKLADAINKVVEETRSEFEATSGTSAMEELVVSAGRVGEDGKTRKGVKNLWSHVASYVECLEANGVETYSELERLWERRYGSQDVRDAVEDVLQAEERNDELCKDIEKEFVKIQSERRELELKNIGDSIPAELKVTDARSKEVQKIQSYWEGSKFTLFVLLRHFG